MYEHHAIIQPLPCAHSKLALALMYACCDVAGGSVISTAAVTSSAYIIQYTSTDALGNVGTPVYRFVSVYDECAPQKYCASSGKTRPPAVQAACGLCILCSLSHCLHFALGTLCELIYVPMHSLSSAG